MEGHTHTVGKRSEEPQEGIVPYQVVNTLVIPNAIGQTFIVIISTSFVLAKCIVRKVYLGKWSAEDWLVVLGWAFLMVVIGVVTYSVASGNGAHQSEIPKEQVHFILYWNNVYTIVYNFSVFFSKSAVLVTYLNLFAVAPKSRDWWFITLMITLNGIFYICSTFLKIFNCTPRYKIWEDFSLDNCVVAIGPLLTTTSVWNTTSDLLVLALPAMFVSRLNINSRVKKQIIVIFVLGAVAYPLCSVVGIVVRALHASDSDQIYWQPRIYIWTEAEICAGLICACLPSAWFVAKRFWRWRSGTYVDIDKRWRTPSGGVLNDFALRGADADAKNAAGPDTKHLQTVLDDVEMGGLKSQHDDPQFSKVALAGQAKQPHAATGTLSTTITTTSIPRGAWIVGANRPPRDRQPSPIFERRWPLHRQHDRAGNNPRHQAREGDEGSDEQQDGQHNGNAGIWKTTEVHVQYDEQRYSTYGGGGSGDEGGSGDSGGGVGLPVISQDYAYSGGNQGQHKYSHSGGRSTGAASARDQMRTTAAAGSSSTDRQREDTRSSQSGSTSTSASALLQPALSSSDDDDARRNGSHSGSEHTLAPDNDTELVHGTFLDVSSASMSGARPTVVNTRGRPVN